MASYASRREEKLQPEHDASVVNPAKASTSPSRSKASSIFAIVSLVGGLFLFSVVLKSASPSLLGDLENPLRLGIWHHMKSYEQRSLDILSKHPLIDGHDDLAIFIRAAFNNKIYGSDFKKLFEDGGMPQHVDLKRIDKGRYAGAFWSAFWLCPNDIFDFSDEAYAPVVQATLSQLDLLSRLSEQYPFYFPITRSAAEAKTNFYKLKKHIAPLAIEGLHQIGNSAATLRLYHLLGVRYATLTWNCHNRYADASTLTFLANETTMPSKPYWGGLSRKGRQLLLEMNRLGMIVDLAHVSPDTMRDALVGQHNKEFPLDADGADGADDADGSNKWNGSLAPPIISHSSVYSICPHPRNVPDSIFPLIKQRKSVMMINFSPDFIACHYDEDADSTTQLPTTDLHDATLKQVVRHIMYVGEKIGYDYVGIGSDFDGIGTTPKGLDGVDKMPDLVAELLKQGVTEKNVVKVIGGNVLRVWDEVDRTSEQMKRDGWLPLEDELKDLFGHKH